MVKLPVSKYTAATTESTYACVDCCVGTPVALSLVIVSSSSRSIIPAVPLPVKYGILLAALVRPAIAVSSASLACAHIVVRTAPASASSRIVLANGVRS